MRFADALSPTKESDHTRLRLTSPITFAASALPYLSQKLETRFPCRSQFIRPLFQPRYAAFAIYCHPDSQEVIMKAATSTWIQMSSGRPLPLPRIQTSPPGQTRYLQSLHQTTKAIASRTSPSSDQMLCKFG